MRTEQPISYLCVMVKSQFVETCNSLAQSETSFLFVIDYELEDFQIICTEDTAENDVFFSINGTSNTVKSKQFPVGDFQFGIAPISFNRYEEAFALVRKNIIHGNSFLLNLTFPTQIETDLTLQQIFYHSRAPYKLLYRNQFVAFSPEAFIKIRDGYIYSYPMKGTIDATVPGAEKILLDNKKEYREHITIVDLIRNDLSIVSKDVSVTKFRYIDRIKTNRNELLQVSSEIRGRLPELWTKELGEILVNLLPAGSISGAPKKKTREIIAKAEGQKRGFYTGIFGLFDGKKLDSGVLIRYIEKTEKGMQFRSGGGITGQSIAYDEYKEMIEKVYVPII